MLTAVTTPPPGWQIIDEDDFRAERAFLEQWMPYAVMSASTLLGVALPEGRLSVVLSLTEIHELRFPVRIRDVATLVGPIDDPASEDDLEVMVRRSRSYAHAVTTRAEVALGLPEAVPDGGAVMCLDLPTIRATAERLSVSTIALLGRVVLHELSHALLRHIDHEPGVLHGYVAEGDAQRDTWVLLTAMLADEAWRPLAQEARLAQVKLAPDQPPAYQRFGQLSPETGRWSHQLPAARLWFTTPPRRVAALMRSQTIEVPVRVDARQGRPSVGDRIVLADTDLAVGPWVVVATDIVSHLENAKDLSAVEAEESQTGKHRGQSSPSWAWLHLDRATDAQGVLDPPRALRSTGFAAVIGPESDEAWRREARVSMESAAEAAIERTRSMEASLRELYAKQYSEDERPTVESYDPFRD